MDAAIQIYIGGFLCGFLTYITLRTVWKCITED